MRLWNHYKKELDTCGFWFRWSSSFFLRVVFYKAPSAQFCHSRLHMRKGPTQRKEELRLSVWLCGLCVMRRVTSDILVTRSRFTFSFLTWQSIIDVLLLPSGQSCPRPWEEIEEGEREKKRTPGWFNHESRKYPDRIASPSPSTGCKKSPSPLPPPPNFPPWFFPPPRPPPPPPQQVGKCLWIFFGCRQNKPKRPSFSLSPPLSLSMSCWHYRPEILKGA